MTGRPDALLAALRALGDLSVSGQEIAVAVPDGTADPATMLVVGLYDLLVERSLTACADEADRERLLRTALSDVSAVEPVLSYALAERSRETERLERAARMRGRQNLFTSRWLVPRLEEEISLYRSRIRALQEALEAKAS
jgi:hypothetical protein